MTYLALARTDQIAAAVIGAAAADLSVLIKHRPEMETEVCARVIPNYARNKKAALAARSAIHWAEKLNKMTPLLILRGSADWRAPPIDVLSMVRRLYECKHPFRFVFFDGGDHNVSEYWEEAQQLTRNWLDRYVRDRKPWPSVELHGR